MTSGPPHRTCIGCRETDDQSALQRFVRVGEVVTADPNRRLPGRGCWLHPRTQCRELAVRRRAFARALRAAVVVPDDLFGADDQPTAGSQTPGEALGS